MELMQLRYFQALAKNGNLTQTANQLFISPPSLSTSISKLEKDLGVTLFDRVGRRLYLNTNGVSFLNHLDTILGSLDYAVAELSDIQKKKDATLFIASTSPNVFQDVFLAFLQKYPNCRLFHTSLKLDQVSDSDLLHKYDFLITSPHDIMPNMEIESHVLYNNDYAVLVMPPNHPLATGSGKSKDICLQAVKDEPFVALSKGYSSRKFFDRLCAAAGFTPNIVMECDYTIRFRMVMEHVGLTVCTAHTVLLNYCCGASIMRVNPPFMSRSQAIYWNPKRYQSKSAKLFRSFICDFFKDCSFNIDECCACPGDIASKQRCLRGRNIRDTMIGLKDKSHN